MAEEAKKQAGASKLLPTLLKLLLGLAFLALGVWAILRWWVYLKIVLLGCVGLFLILAGIITLAIAKE